jgi:hypothetical protein
MELQEILKPLGIASYLLMGIVFLFGIMRWKFKVHRLLGIIAIIMATAHGILVAWTYWPDVF